MAKLDYYEALGISRSAADGEIKVAFRKMAMKYHPDRNPGDSVAEEKFKEINEAYEVLKDPQKRSAYDRYGHAAFEQGGGMGGAGFGHDFSDFMTDIFDTFFNDSSSRGGARQRSGSSGRERGADMRYNLEITLEDAFIGKTETIEVPSSITCEACSGNGAKSGSKPRQCPTCGGAGRVRAQQGFFAIERTCPTCDGRGQIIENPCDECSGAGRVARMRTLSVNIPPGVEDGTRIRLSGEGEAGLRGGPSGDLYIFLSVRPHELYQRDGADLFCRAPVSMVTAALGGEFNVPTVDGQEVRVQVPAGTQTGKQLRLRGKGMPILRSRDFGDLYIQVVVETPQNLSKRQKELLAEFDQASSLDTHPESAGFLARLKDFFEGLKGPAS